MPFHAEQTHLAINFNMRWWKRKKERERFFLKNGGKMLEQIITSFNGKCNPIRSFSEEELIETTNNYDDGRKLLHRHRNFYVYEGTNESRSVLVKKFIIQHYTTPEEILELVTNDIAIASNMSNHSNFLKLLGCCLETEVPILVYESGVNLSHEMINSLPWETKLRIANEMANAFAYLHYGTSRIIIHTNIKIGNIYLNQDNIAKVSDFQTSVLIPLGKTHVDAEVISGTTGYLAPEYLENGRLSEKSDVFSFGIVLMDILTGKKILKLQKQCGRFDDIVQHHLKNSVLTEEIRRQEIQLGELILKCVRDDPDGRPTMQEAAQAIKSIRNMF
ncbi:non-functional pseudokinase ZRK2-like [Tripterygium wilfordii]|uniref:non-functional pseudokinase ZRK2-like n=1 Tax=Tripterygium wilfordii TaxID=458696 RepID=UPI0018F84070|nr:non-functional pseudokinase ZRK2-like [Tripterygium wilfordii]